MTPESIEKIIQELFPKHLYDAVGTIAKLRKWLAEGVLVVPMTLEQIEQTMYDIPEEYMDDFSEEHISDIAKAIHERQFKQGEGV